MAALQAFTQKETVTVVSPFGQRDAVVEPFGSYTVGRLHKDWGKGHTSLGGMVTSTHRWVNDPALAFLPAQATTAGLDFTRYFANRSWVLEANGVLSHVTRRPGRPSWPSRGTRSTTTSGPTRATWASTPDGPPSPATGALPASGAPTTGRLRLTDHFHFYSPGLELNDAGYLRQADLVANQMFLGWSEPKPKGAFRSYAVQLSREDQWDFGGLGTRSTTSLDASSMFKNKWEAQAHAAYDDVVDTRMLRGGPALRWHDYFTLSLGANTDSSRRASVSMKGERAWARDDDSHSSKIVGGLNLRLSNRLSLSGSTSYEQLFDNLQYVATADAAGGTRWVMGLIDQDTWSFTFRVDVSITPSLTVQYYGSPFLSTGHYGSFKKATDTLASAYEARFHLYGPDEITFAAPDNAYRVTEAGGGPSYSFANPDFSFRQFRSNLVARWEWKPGSSVYVVWSQGRTGYATEWNDSFHANWSQLWREQPDNVFLVKLSYWFSP